MGTITLKPNFWDFTIKVQICSDFPNQSLSVIVNHELKHNLMSVTSLQNEVNEFVRNEMTRHSAVFVINQDITDQSQPTTAGDGDIFLIKVFDFIDTFVTVNFLQRETSQSSSEEKSEGKKKNQKVRVEVEQVEERWGDKGEGGSRGERGRG